MLMVCIVLHKVKPRKNVNVSCKFMASERVIQKLLCSQIVGDIKKVFFVFLEAGNKVIHVYNHHLIPPHFFLFNKHSFMPGNR